MTIVLTLLVRDEEDVLETNLAHHFAIGVDHVVVTDHRSTDGTSEILDRFARAGRVTVIREDSDELRQSDWVTRMARLAATELGATWVLHGDADEFWWPREGSLHDLLAAIPARYGVVRGLWRNFVPRPDDGRPFAERMTVRRRPAAELTDPFHAQVKVAHRAHPDVVVTQGNHDVLGPPLPLIREWLPFEILHFPIRTPAQAERKFRVARDAGLRSLGTSVPQHTAAAARLLDAGGATDYFESLVVDEPALARGLHAGELVVDTRLRDELGVTRGGAARAHRPPNLEDDVAFAIEAQVMLAHDSWVNLDVRARRLERSVSAMEASPLIRKRRG